MVTVDAFEADAYCFLPRLTRGGTVMTRAGDSARQNPSTSASGKYTKITEPWSSTSASGFMSAVQTLVVKA